MATRRKRKPAKKTTTRSKLRAAAKRQARTKDGRFKRGKK